MLVWKASVNIGKMGTAERPKALVGIKAQSIVAAEASDNKGPRVSWCQRIIKSGHCFKPSDQSDEERVSYCFPAYSEHNQSLRFEWLAHVRCSGRDCRLRLLIALKISSLWVTTLEWRVVGFAEYASFGLVVATMASRK